MTLGHGEAPLYACPIAKSGPLAENPTVFSVSAPIAFDAAAIVVPASCAAATDANTATASAARIDLLVIVPSKQQLTRADSTTHSPCRCTSLATLRWRHGGDSRAAWRTTSRSGCS